MSGSRLPGASDTPDYDGWKVRRWETPVSGVERLAMVSLTDTKNRLEIVFEALRDAERPRWRVTFTGRYPVYRNTDEGRLCALWSWLDSSSQRCGSTFTVEDSRWAAANVWVEGELRHFVLSTLDDVIEVLATEEPTWESLGPAPSDAPTPGKSEHLFLPEDRQAVNALEGEIRERQERLRSDEHIPPQA